MCPLITPSGSKISLSMRKQKGALTLRSLVPRTYRSLKKTTVLWAAKVAMVAAAMAANLATVVVVAVVTAALLDLRKSPVPNEETLLLTKAPG